MIKAIRDYQWYQYRCSICSIQHRKKQWLWQHCIIPSSLLPFWAKNKSVDYSHSTFGISFCCYLIHWQWSKRDEMQWRSKVRFKGIVLTCCISSLDTMLQSHPHSTHPRTHTEEKKNKKKLPHKTSTARITPQLQHKYYCNVQHRDMQLCKAAGLNVSPPAGLLMPPFFLVCPSGALFPFLFSPHLAHWPNEAFQRRDKVAKAHGVCVC